MAKFEKSPPSGSIMSSLFFFRSSFGLLFFFCCSFGLLFLFCYSLLFGKRRNTNSGTILSRYVLGERRTFVSHIPSPCEIVYYIGQKITVVTKEPLREYAEDVTLVCFDDCESAKKEVERSHWFDMRHDCVLPAKSYTYDAGLNKHLVCFDRFDGFLPQADPAFLASLQKPNSSLSVPGNPINSVQLEIKALIEALEHMLSKGVSSTSLHLPTGYVWFQGNSRHPRKLMLITLYGEDRDEHTSVQWKNIIARDVKRFGIGLSKYFLNTDVVWPQKESFLRCFSMRLSEENRRLPMIRDHPFLKNYISEILQIFSSIHRDLRAADPSDIDVLRWRKLMVALNGKQFKSEFMPNGEWIRQGMSPQFNAYLRGNPRGKSVKYNTKDMGDLLRFLRNLYENYYENSMSLHFIFNEVGRYWPHLADRFHEKIAGVEASDSVAFCQPSDVIT